MSSFSILLLLSFLLPASTQAFDPGVGVTDDDVKDMLAQPLEERLQMLKSSQGIRDRLAQFAFDPKQSLNVRWRSLTALADLSAKSYRWEIERALKSREWFMRNAGLIGIVHDDRKVAIDWSIKLLSDPALVVRTQAVQNLIRLEAVDARDQIWNSLYAQMNMDQTHNLWVRGYLAKALALWARPADQKRFLKMLMDKDQEVQKWAIQGLERATGLRISDPSEPIGVQKDKWISRLGSQI